MYNNNNTYNIIIQLKIKMNGVTFSTGVMIINKGDKVVSIRLVINSSEPNVSHLIILYCGYDRQRFKYRLYIVGLDGRKVFDHFSRVDTT